MLCCQRGDYMNKDNELLDLTTDNKSTIKKRKYSKPELICYGDVRDITLGATMPGAESGGGGTRCDDPFCP